MSDEQAEISPEQIQLIRSSFLTSAANKYIDLIKFLKELPFQQEQFYSAFHELDSGWLWIQEIISKGIFIPSSPAPEAIEHIIEDQLPAA